MNEAVPMALLMNDLHISETNIDEFRKNWHEAIDICNSKHIHILCIGGDMFTSRASQGLSPLICVSDILGGTPRENKMEIFIAEGNHDKVDPESWNGYNHLFNGYQSVHVANDYATVFVSGNVWLIMMSYFPEKGSFQEKLEEVKEHIGKQKCRQSVLYIHEGINGGLATPSEKELPSNIFDGFLKVLVGHYHDRKKIPGTNIEYIGASRQHNFGEDEEKGYTVLYSDGSTEFIKNTVNRRYKTIRMGYGECAGDLSLEKENGYVYRALISCKQEEAEKIDRQKLIDAGFSKVEIQTEDIVAEDVSQTSFNAKFDSQGIRDEYKNFCANAGHDSELGLKYMEDI